MVALLEDAYLFLYVLYKMEYRTYSRKTNNMIQWDKDVKYQFQRICFFLIGL